MPSLLLLVATASSALFSMTRIGPVHQWPESWPHTFHLYTDQTQKLEIMTGYQADWYQISLQSSEDFERLWPSLVALMDRGSQVTIRVIGDEHHYAIGEPSWDCSNPVVRIIAPRSDCPFAGYPPTKDRAGHHFSSERMKLQTLAEGGMRLSPEDEAVVNAQPFDRNDLSPDLDAMQVNNGKWIRFGPPWPDYLLDESGALPEQIHEQTVDGRLRWVAGRGDGFFYQCRVDLELVVDYKVIDPERIEFPKNVKVIDLRTGPWAQRP